MTQIPEYQRGYQDALRAAVEWLHTRAKTMNDPHAASVLNSAATNLGWDLKEIVGRAAPLRCEVTGNPVGTDTRMIGAPPCQCRGCRASRPSVFLDEKEKAEAAPLTGPGAKPLSQMSWAELKQVYPRE